MNQITMDELKILYIDNKMTMKEISKCLLISVGKIHKLIHKFGIEPRITSELNRGRKPSAEHIEKLRKINTGKTLTEKHKLILSNIARERTMEKHPNFKGGRFNRKDGYVQIKTLDHPMSDCEGYVLEHRLVMESILSRHLNKNEVVHHINGNKKDNSPENLMIFNSIRDHRKYHHFLNKRREM